MARSHDLDEQPISQGQYRKLRNGDLRTVGAVALAGLLIWLSLRADIADRDHDRCVGGNDTRSAIKLGVARGIDRAVIKASELAGVTGPSVDAGAKQVADDVRDDLDSDPALASNRKC